MTDALPYAFQANFKFGPQYKEALINVPAQTPEELLGKLSWLTENAAAFVAAQTALLGVEALAPLAGHVASVSVQQEPQAQPSLGGWGGVQQAPPPSFVENLQQQYAQPAQPPAPTCQHGARVFREGTNAQGKPWKAWFCSSKDRANQCDAAWVK